MKKKKNDIMMMRMEENNNTPRVSRSKDGPITIPTTIVSTATTTHRSNNKSRFATTPTTTTTVDDGGGIDCSGKYLKSCMAGLIADCVALCCCPCAVFHCFALAFVKAPWVVGRRCLGLGKRKNKDKNVKRKCCKRGYDYEEDDDVNDVSNVDLVLHRNNTNNVVGEMDNVTVNGAFESDKVWLELYQIAHLDFGRVSTSHD